MDYKDISDQHLVIRFRQQLFSVASAMLLYKYDDEDLSWRMDHLIQSREMETRPSSVM
uniref:Bm1070 n=1 Tax=Brugia malayi TaxID=6279 RepID=A0A1I9G6A9_BRUMA|nr:Bm1070 [Brugia malayi]